MLPHCNTILSYARLSSCRRDSSRKLSTCWFYDHHGHGCDRWGIDMSWEWNLWSLDMSPHYLTLLTWQLQQGTNCDVKAPCCTLTAKPKTICPNMLPQCPTDFTCFSWRAYACDMLSDLSALAPLCQGRGAVSDPSKWPCWLQLDGLESPRRSGCRSLLVLQVLHLRTSSTKQLSNVKHFFVLRSFKCWGSCSLRTFVEWYLTLFKRQWCLVSGALLRSASLCPAHWARKGICSPTLKAPLSTSESKN